MAVRYHPELGCGLVPWKRARNKVQQGSAVAINQINLQKPTLLNGRIF